MKYLLALFFLNISAYCQEFKIPDFQFMETFEGENPYVSLFNLKDKNALIIKVKSSSYWFKGTFVNFLIFQNDGNIFTCQAFLDEKNNSKYKLKKVTSKKKRSILFKYLENLKIKDSLNINKDLLKITTKENEDGTMSAMTVSDSIAQTFEITQGSKTTYFGFYSVQSYIDAKYPGLEDKIKFSKLISDFENLINN